MPNSILSAFIRLPISIRILSISIFIIVFFGTVISYIEPNNFPTLFDGIWWAIITTSTVGYGDSVPGTILGKITGIVLIFTGVGFLSSYLIALATAAVSKQNQVLEGRSSYSGQNHIIIIGWNERSKRLIHSLITENKQISLTLIDETLTNNPLAAYVHFIKGNPNIDDTLKRAKISSASKVIITSDQSKDEMQTDMNSILTLLAVKGLNPNVICIIELLTIEQISNAKRAGADEIIQTNSIISFVMHNSLQSEDTIIAFLDTLNQLKDKKFHIIPLKNIIKETKLDYASLSIYILKEGMLLLGIKRGGKSFINPSASFEVGEEDELIVIY